MALCLKIYGAARQQDLRQAPQGICLPGSTDCHGNGRKERRMCRKFWLKHQVLTDAKEGIIEVPDHAAERDMQAQDDTGKSRGRRSLSYCFAALSMCFMLLAVSGAVPVFASSGGSGSVIDSSLVGELVDLVKQVAGLFNVFPINVFLIGSLAGLGFTLFRKAKRTAVE